MNDRQIIEAAVTILPLLHELLGAHAADIIRRLAWWLAPERTGTEEAARQVLAILAENAETLRWLREYLPEPADATKSLFRKPVKVAPHTVPPQEIAEAPKKYEVARIYFATDRAATTAVEPRRIFGGERDLNGELHFGTCHVSIPVSHAKGNLESPPWFLRHIWEDPAKHIVLLRVATLTAQDFFGDVRRSGTQALLFIHGYDVTFEDAARRTAQLVSDLKFNGAPILYSWPSHGSPAGYFADEASVEWTVEHLRDFLCALAERGGITDLHVIAHSMGNRALTGALRMLGYETRRVTNIREVILTAPDIDSGLFRQSGADLVTIPRRITMYASKDDVALQASHKFHQYPRAGEGGDSIIILPGIDSIDASGADTSFLGHSYFGSVRSIISDVFYTIGGTPAANRSDLRSVVSALGTYFRYML